MVELILDIRDAVAAPAAPVKVTVIVPPFPAFETAVVFPPEVVAVLEEGGKLAHGIVSIQDMSLKLIVANDCAVVATVDQE